MKRYLLTALLLVGACTRHDQDRGTCVESYRGTFWCSVNTPRYQCVANGSRFDVEPWQQGLSRCKQLGYTRYDDLGTAEDGTHVNLRGDIAWNAERALAKGGWVTLDRPR
jgi:hypothetical protein